MSLASIVTLLIAIVALAEFAIWERRDQGINWSEIDHPVSAGGRGIAIILGTWVAWLLSLLQSPGFALALAALCIWYRSYGQPDVYCTRSGILAHRPIWGPGRENRLAWDEIDSVISEMMQGEGQITHIVTVAGRGREINFPIDDPAEFFDMMSKRGIPTASY